MRDPYTEDDKTKVGAKNLMEFARQHSLQVVEDACEAIGSHYRGRSVGTFGCAGAIAFYPNIQMT